MTATPSKVACPNKARGEHDMIPGTPHRPPSAPEAKTKRKPCGWVRCGTCRAVVEPSTGRWYAGS